MATLSAILGDDADAVLSALDDLNAGIAQVHQDAFKNVYDSIKNYFAQDEEDNEEASGRSWRSKVYVDCAMQKQMADMAIDKMANSAVMLIQQQPQHAQDAAANVFTMGTTLVADCMEICLEEMDALEHRRNDFIRLEDSWNTVKASVGCAVAGLRCIFNLMAVSDPEPEGRTSRNGSFAQATGGMFRRLSNAFGGPIPNSSRSASVSAVSNASSSRSGSLAVPEYRTPNYLRNSVSSAVPTSLPSGVTFRHTQLEAIPPTPFTDEGVNPFDTSVPLVPELPVMPATA